MLLFGSLATLLVAALVVALVWPLVRRGAVVAAPDVDAASVAIYRDQKKSLDAELASGTIALAEHDAAVNELSRRLAEEAPPDVPESLAPPRRSHALAVVLVLAIPIAALGLYYRLGNPEAANAIAEKPQVSDQQIAAMVDGLAARLKQNPTDAQGWTLLARSYHSLERYPEAADAYAHANELVHGDAGLLVDYADALAMAQGKTLAGKPEALVQQALAIDPQNRKALALAATGALEARDVDASLGYWRRLAATLPPESDEAAQVNAFIAQIAGAKAQVDGDAAPSAKTAPAPAASPPPSASAAGGPEAIAGRVDLSPQLAGKVSPSDSVFIFARATQGPRMPLAVLRITARDLPKEFSLDDSLSMAASAKLSSSTSVVLEARISKQGSAMPQAGDLYGRLTDVKPGTKGIRLTIDQVVP